MSFSSQQRCPGCMPLPLQAVGHLLALRLRACKTWALRFVLENTAEAFVSKTNHGKHRAPSSTLHGCGEQCMVRSTRHMHMQVHNMTLIRCAAPACLPRWKTEKLLSKTLHPLSLATLLHIASKQC